MFDMCSTCVRHVFDTCSTYVRHVCSTYVRHMFDICSTYVRLVFDMCSTCVRLVFDLCSTCCISFGSITLVRCVPVVLQHYIVAMASSQRPADSSRVQHNDEALLNALSKRPVDTGDHQRRRKQQRQRAGLAYDVNARTPRYQLDDDDSWSDVCMDEYRAVVKRGQCLWRQFSRRSSDPAPLTSVSEQSVRPGVAETNIVASRTIDNDMAIGDSWSGENSFVRQVLEDQCSKDIDQQPSEDTESIVVHVDQPLQVHAPPGEKHSEFSVTPVGGSTGVVGCQQASGPADQRPAPLPCDVEPLRDDAVSDGVEVCCHRRNVRKRRR